MVFGTCVSDILVCQVVKTTASRYCYNPEVSNPCLNENHRLCNRLVQDHPITILLY